MFTAVAFLEIYLIVQNILTLRSVPMNEWDNWKWVTFAITILLIIFFLVTVYFSINEIKEKIAKNKEVVEEAKQIVEKKEREEIAEKEEMFESQIEVSKEVTKEVIDGEKTYQELLEELTKDD